MFKKSLREYIQRISTVQRSDFIARDLSFANSSRDMPMARDSYHMLGPAG